MADFELNFPSQEQKDAALKAMRLAHFDHGYTRWPRDHYLETIFWAGFFAAYLHQQKSQS